MFEDGTDIYWARVADARVPLRRSCRALPAGRRDRTRARTRPAWAGSSSTPWWTSPASTSLAELRSLPGLVPALLPARSVPGVAEVAPIGGFGKQYQVNVDPNRLQAYGISISRVVEAVRGGNAEVGRPADRVRRARSTWSAAAATPSPSRTSSRSSLAAERQRHARSASGTSARWSLGPGPPPRRRRPRRHGRGRSRGIVVMRQGENALDVIDRVKAKLEEIEPGAARRASRSSRSTTART
ncbi:MAG: efflux RND transporter permease subunit [Candidatus Moduliflexus flocculans]|nr:efflux RND transporter permease subunit [Candidatus Moduliflexus flocculans]